MVSVEEQKITISYQFPVGTLERFKQLVDRVVGAIEKTFKPRLLLGMSIELEYVTHIGEDARKRLVRGLDLAADEDEGDELSKLSVFDRPGRLVCLRLGFWPYVADEKE